MSRIEAPFKNLSLVTADIAGYFDIFTENLAFISPMGLKDECSYCKKGYLYQPIRYQVREVASPHHFHPDVFNGLEVGGIYAWSKDYNPTTYQDLGWQAELRPLGKVVEWGLWVMMERALVKNIKAFCTDFSCRAEPIRLPLRNGFCQQTHRGEYSAICSVHAYKADLGFQVIDDGQVYFFKP